MDIYLSSEWEDYQTQTKLEILRHERQHLLQFKKYGLVLMSFIYLFFPLPFIFALGRTYFEKAGYDETVRARVEYYGNVPWNKAQTKIVYVQAFISSGYLWMFPFQKTVEEWFEKSWDKAVKEFSLVS